MESFPKPLTLNPALDLLFWLQKKRFKNQNGHFCHLLIWSLPKIWESQALEVSECLQLEEGGRDNHLENLLIHEKGNHQDVNSLLHQSFRTSFYYPSFIFHLERHKEFIDGKDGFMGLKWVPRLGPNIGSQGSFPGWVSCCGLVVCSHN